MQPCNNPITVGSVCSGIEAASVAWNTLGFDSLWFSETAPFPCRLLGEKYPSVPNVGDMQGIGDRLDREEIPRPDLICGGTPCQAFSLAGWKKGLEDRRGNLTLTFVEIVDTNDRLRERDGLASTVVFWENVEGVLKDKTNAFGCFISSLAGLGREVGIPRWPSAGVLHGPKRNVAWRLLDAKYFGPPQQRRRLYLMAGGKDFYPENILFEDCEAVAPAPENPSPLRFRKDGQEFEVFRSYSDCLYAAYGTKWNGNAAAYNGSLFVLQGGLPRRLTPLECERLMGFPDDYTALPGAKATSRYQALGNSWSVPVVRWLGGRIRSTRADRPLFDPLDPLLIARTITSSDDTFALDLSGEPLHQMPGGRVLNASEKPARSLRDPLSTVVSASAPKSFYISPAGCQGILRRCMERDLSMNGRLRIALEKMSSEWSEEKIELVSRKQRRGRFATPTPEQGLLPVASS
jgi:DNA (cytosine-5)-methyltransferase 1